MLTIFLFSSLFLVFSQQTQVVNRTLLTDAATNTGALCMDGSPGAYFLSLGTETIKWIMYFEGGGWCGCLGVQCSKGFDTCYSRSQGYLGSTSLDISQNTEKHLR